MFYILSSGLWNAWQQLSHQQFDNFQTNNSENVIMQVQDHDPQYLSKHPTKPDEDSKKVNYPANEF